MKQKEKKTAESYRHTSSVALCGLSIIPHTLTLVCDLLWPMAWRWNRQCANSNPRSYEAYQISACSFVFLPYLSWPAGLVRWVTHSEELPGCQVVFQLRAEPPSQTEPSLVYISLSPSYAQILKQAQLRSAKPCRPICRSIKDKCFLWKN